MIINLKQLSSFISTFGLILFIIIIISCNIIVIYFDMLSSSSCLFTISNISLFHLSQFTQIFYGFFSIFPPNPSYCFIYFLLPR